MQTPFCSLFIYLKEAPEGQERDDLVRVATEIFKQRIKGVKNKKGTWVAPAFPKLLYVLDTENHNETCKYWNLTKLAAECTAKRMVPDYISEKIMNEYKEGNTYGCMGCYHGDEVITYKLNDILYVESGKRLWNRILSTYGYSHAKGQRSHNDPFKYINTEPFNLKVYDTNLKDFVKVKCLNRNITKEWRTVKLSNGRIVDVSDNHPFTTDTEDMVYAKDLKPGMKILANYSQYVEENYNLDTDYSWFMGFVLADGCYDHQFSVTIAEKSEDDIETKYKDVVKKLFDLDVETKIWRRGKKGNYKELKVRSNENSNIDKKYSIRDIRDMFRSSFDGKEKIKRHIPNFVFNSDKESRLAFLGGMIDADGYAHYEDGYIALGSTNKEMAIQQMLLAQSCGMPAKIHHNHYKSNHSDKIRYAVYFYPTEELLNYISCKKKIDKCKTDKQFSNITSGAHYVEVLDVVDSSSRINNEYGWEYSYDMTTESEHFEFSGLYSHNCRAFLSVWRDPETGIPKFYGRYNKQVCTVNLPDVALTIRDKYGLKDNESLLNNKEAIKEFWELLDERLEMVHKVLLIRINHLKGTKSDVAPILWQYGAIARLKPGETIDKTLSGGYSTTSLGFVGLFETMMALTGKPHTDPENQEFAESIVRYMKETCDKWNKIPGENYGFSLYGTPEESTTEKFSKALQKRHGIIKGITDKMYVMNSYHTDIKEPVDAFTKLNNESRFQKWTNAGAISYVEMPNLINNQEAILSVMKYIYDHCWYAELNSKIDNCHKCGFSGEIKMVKDENNKLVWECPQCGNRSISDMTVVRRVCGYLSNANCCCQGRMADIGNRVLHL